MAERARCRSNIPAHRATPLFWYLSRFHLQRTGDLGVIVS
jgi:hypothetical protein